MEIKLNLLEDQKVSHSEFSKVNNFSRSLSRELNSLGILVYLSNCTNRLIFTNLIRATQVSAVFQNLPEILNQLEYITDSLKVELNLHKTVRSIAEFELVLFQKRFEIVHIRRIDAYKSYVINSYRGFKSVQSVYKLVSSIRRKFL